MGPCVRRDDTAFGAFAAPPPVSSPGLTGGSSTPRLLDSITDRLWNTGSPAFAGMTIWDTPSRSRGVKTPESCKSSAPKRAWGMPGAQCTRSLVWVEKPHELVTTSTPENPAFPHAMVYGLFRVLPGARALWSPSPVELLPQTWRQRRGVRTTRLCRPLSRRSSPALPASTASRPAFRDVAQRPSVGRDEANIGTILILENRNIFAERTGQPKSA
jgi:hypothetical protein